MQLLIKSFVRPLPTSPVYRERLDRELALISRFGFYETFLKLREILDLDPDLPHIIRGSGGSSLVAYLLGISNIDPVACEIPLVRFMNSHRTELPDIDLDFPHHLRDGLLEKVFRKFGKKAARISNRVHYGWNGAVRESIRRHGVNTFVPKYFNLKDILPGRERSVIELASRLVGQQYTWSLHCGGVLLSNEPIPNRLFIGPHQIALDKYDIKKYNLLKLDFLCNRALSQLHECSDRPIHEYPTHDSKTAQIFSSGNVVGVTSAESPLVKRTCIALQPKCVDDICLMMALIRPKSGGGGRKREFLQHWKKTRTCLHHVFEEDIIITIQDALGCDEDEAETHRKILASGRQSDVIRFMKHVPHHLRQKTHRVVRDVGGYGFCKAHAISYGRLAWALAYNKAHHPDRFWRAVETHCQSFYRPWVHDREIRRHFQRFEHHPDPIRQLEETKSWSTPDFLPDCYIKPIGGGRVKFCGLIATGRVYADEKNDRCATFLTVGVKNGSLLDLVIDSKKDYGRYRFVKGKARPVEDLGSISYHVEDFCYF